MMLAQAPRPVRTPYAHPYAQRPAYVPGYSVQAAPSAAYGMRSARTDPFARGRVSVMLLAGSAWLSDRDYLILGAGLGYYLANGLELGVEGSTWLFDDPFIGTLTPQAKYVFHMVPIFKPYGGGFWRHYMVGSDVEDFDSLGARAGFYMVLGRSRSYLGFGGVYEHMLDCNARIRECDSVYPELTFTFSI